MIKVAMILILNCNKLFLCAYELEYRENETLGFIIIFKKKKERFIKEIYDRR
jgi:hypothetical protein